MKWETLLNCSLWITTVLDLTRHTFQFILFVIHTVMCPTKCVLIVSSLSAFTIYVCMSYVLMKTVLSLLNEAVNHTLHLNLVVINLIIHSE